MSSGESPGTAGKIRRLDGGFALGDGVVPLARLKFEKSSTMISVVEESSVTFGAADVAVVVVVVRTVVVVVVSVVDV